jgi:hypothetical protein
MSAGDDLLQLGIEPVKPRKAATLGEAGYARKEHDFYPTPPWVTGVLVRYIDFHLRDIGPAGSTIWEPACGDGRMAEVLAAAGYRVVASDIADYGYGAVGCDFLGDRANWQSQIPIPSCAAIVTNPPFDLARVFVARALELTRAVRGKVAILQRHEFDAPKINHDLFGLTGGVRLVLHKRPKWFDDEKASPRFPFCWFIFDWRRQTWGTLWCSDPNKPLDGESLL